MMLKTMMLTWTVWQTSHNSDVAVIKRSPAM
jgi:hypothetical protein